MYRKLAVLPFLLLSATCMLPPVPIILHQPDNPSYQFAYEVNDATTGDIKNQQESRRGDTVIGQYSLVQPDGVKRIVDYRADDLRGFRATVNNEGKPIVNKEQSKQEAITEAPKEEPRNVVDVTQWPAENTVLDDTNSPISVFRTILHPIPFIRNNLWI